MSYERPIPNKELPSERRRVSPEENIPLDRNSGEITGHAQETLAKEADRIAHALGHNDPKRVEEYLRGDDI